MSIKEDCNLWHKKIGYISLKQISKLSSKNTIRGLPKLRYKKSDLCSACTLGNQVKSTFKPIKYVSTNRVLQLLLEDIFGPTRSQSMGGKKYYLIIVYDYTKFTWVFFSYS